MNRALLLLPLLLVGCQTAPTTDEPPIPANLLVPCPDLTPLADDQAGTVLEKLVEISGQYYACQTKDNKLIEAAKHAKRNP